MATLKYAEKHADPGNDDIYNTYVDRLANILNEDYQRWGMKHSFYKFDNQRIAQFPSGCILYMGNTSEWKVFPTVREATLKSQIWYYYERHDKEIAEEKLRYYTRGIEETLIRNFTLHGFAIMSNVSGVEIKFTPVGSNIVMAAVFEHEAKVRERYELIP